MIEKKGVALEYQVLGKHSPSGWTIMLLSGGRGVCYHFTVCQPVPWAKAIKWSSAVSWTEFQTQGLKDQSVQPAISLVSHKCSPAWRRGCDMREPAMEKAIVDHPTSISLLSPSHQQRRSFFRQSCRFTDLRRVSPNSSPRRWIMIGLKQA